MDAYSRGGADSRQSIMGYKNISQAETIMDIERYLQRIGYDGAREPSMETLRRLQRAHLFSVPFENLDIPLQRPIVLSPPSLFEKIVTRRRGGFCYELNGLFFWLLQELGFEPAMLSARVFGDDRLGPDFDHMLLLVGNDEKRIVDVGFGDSFIEPLPLNHEQHNQAGRAYRLTQENGEWTLYQQTPGADWRAQYAFGLQPRRLEEFESMCLYQQTSPDSSFTKKAICSLAVAEGRVSLSNGRLILTRLDAREERTITDPAEYRALLKKYFAIELDADKPLACLLKHQA